MAADWRAAAIFEQLLQHLRKEEYVLFPYVRELAVQPRTLPSPFGTVENPIRMMEQEHDNASVQLRKIRRLTADYTVPIVIALWRL